MFVLFLHKVIAAVLHNCKNQLIIEVFIQTVNLYMIALDLCFQHQKKQFNQIEIR